MADMVYRLVLRARFEDAGELSRVTQELERLRIQGARVSVTLAEGGRRGAFGLNTIARSALRVGFMLNMLESAYMRQTMAMMIMENAQDRYNDAVRRYGRNSEEARRAARRLEQQMRYLHLANTRANISMALMITQLALQSGLLDQATLASIRAKLASWAMTAANWLETASWKAKAIAIGAATAGLAVPFIIAGMAAAAAATANIPSKQTGGFVEKTGIYMLHAGEYVVPAEQVPPRSVINIQTQLNVETDLDEALREQNRIVKSEFRRLTR